MVQFKKNILKSLLFVFVFFVSFTGTVEAADTTPPVITINAPSPASPNSSQLVTFAGSATDASGIYLISIKLDGTTLKNCPGVTSCSFTGGPYSVGTHTFKIFASDNIFNTRSFFYTFNVTAPPDTTPPSVSGARTPASPTSVQNISFTGYADDASGTLGIDIYIDGIYKKGCHTSGVTTCIYYGGAYSVGTHTFMVEAYDRFYNSKNVSYSFYVTPETTPPVITMYALSPASPNSAQMVTFSGSATDASGIYAISIKLDGTTLKNCPGVTSCSFTGGPYSVGTHTFQIYAADSYLNNKSSFTTFNVTQACAANSGNTCYSSYNSCNQRTSGTTNCSGVCSVTTAPANPSIYNNVCYTPYNSCNQRTAGTTNCSGVCSVTTAPANPSIYNNVCYTPYNSCNQRTAGKTNCSGVCSVTTAPANPSIYNNVCYTPYNSCNQRTAGTTNCSGVCSVTTAPANPSIYNNVCYTPYNSCNQRTAGTTNCSGVCSVTTAPANPFSATPCGTNACGESGTRNVCTNACEGIPYCDAINPTIGTITMEPELGSVTTDDYVSLTVSASDDVGGSGLEKIWMMPTGDFTTVLESCTTNPCVYNNSETYSAGSQSITIYASDYFGNITAAYWSFIVTIIPPTVTPNPTDDSMNYSVESPAQIELSWGFCDASNLNGCLGNQAGYEIYLEKIKDGEVVEACTMSIVGDGFDEAELTDTAISGSYINDRVKEQCPLIVGDFITYGGYSYTWKIRVFDEDGNASEWSDIMYFFYIDIDSPASKPTPDHAYPEASFTMLPTTPIEAKKTTFIGVPNTGHGPYTYKWTFCGVFADAEGNLFNTDTIEYIFPDAGECDGGVKLTVTDGSSFAYESTWIKEISVRDTPTMIEAAP